MLYSILNVCHTGAEHAMLGVAEVLSYSVQADLVAILSVSGASRVNVEWGRGTLRRVGSVVGIEIFIWH